jgi:hypothetical protein
MNYEELNKTLIIAGWSRMERRLLIRNSKNGKLKRKKFNWLKEKFARDLLPFARKSDIL